MFLIFIVTGIRELFYPSQAFFSRKLLSIDHDLGNVFIMFCVSSERAVEKR